MLVVVRVEQTPREFGCFTLTDSVKVAATHDVIKQFPGLSNEPYFCFLTFCLSDSYDRICPVNITNFNHKST